MPLAKVACDTYSIVHYNSFLISMPFQSNILYYTIYKSIQIGYIKILKCLNNNNNNTFKEFIIINGFISRSNFFSCSSIMNILDLGINRVNNVLK